MQNKFYDLTIIICLYNSERFINTLFKNLKKLDQNKIQVVFVNDGSSDNTKKELLRFENFKNFKIINQNNKGLGGARNTAIKNSNSDWIAILDHDDQFTSEKIEFCNNFKSNNYELNNKILFANTYLINNNLKTKKFSNDYFIKNKIKLLKDSIYFNLLKKGCFIVSSSSIINKNIFNNLNGFNESLKVTCDYDFFLRAAKICNFQYINEFHCEWFEHDNQTTNISKFMHYNELVFLYKRELKNINIFNSSYFFIYIKLLKYKLKKIILTFAKYGT